MGIKNVYRNSDYTGGISVYADSQYWYKVTQDEWMIFILNKLSNSCVKHKRYKEPRLS